VCAPTPKSPMVGPPGGDSSSSSMAEVDDLAPNGKPELGPVVVRMGEVAPPRK
jgi:hypothetical protein